MTTPRRISSRAFPVLILPYDLLEDLELALDVGTKAAVENQAQASDESAQRLLLG